MKTLITYFVSDKKGNQFNGEISMPPKMSRNAVCQRVFDHAAARGFYGHQITVTATGCKQPMLAETILN